MFDFSSPVLENLLPHEARAMLMDMGRCQTYRDGEIISERGPQPHAMSLVASGMVRFDRLFDDGRRVLLAIVRAGQNFGDQNGIAQLNLLHHATAIGETEIRHYSQEEFDRLLTVPGAMRALYYVSSFRFVQAMELLDDIRAMPPELRLAKLLLTMRESAGGQDRLDCVQEDIASLLGMSSVTLTKALGILRKSGLIETGYRQVTIKDPQTMATLLQD